MRARRKKVFDVEEFDYEKHGYDGYFAWCYEEFGHGYILTCPEGGQHFVIKTEFEILYEEVSE